MRSSFAIPAVAVLLVAACSTTTPTPSSSPTPSATPVSSTSPSRSPDSSPTPFEGDIVIATFLRDFAEAQPPFHVEAEILVTGSSSATVSIEMDASKEDYKGRVHADVEGVIADVEVIFVDGVAYGRTEMEDWQVIPGFQQTQPINPFDRLDASEIEYIGPVEHSGDILHQLRTVSWIGEDVGDMQLDPIASPAVADPVFDIFVGDDGIPQEAQLRFSITGTSDAQPIRIDYVVDYRFSDVGVPVEIIAPEIHEPSPTAEPSPTR